MKGTLSLQYKHNGKGYDIVLDLNHEAREKLLRTFRRVYKKSGSERLDILFDIEGI